MKLLCIGDSLTTGYGVSKEDSWISLVENSLGIDMINRGVNGDTTAGMLSRSFRDVVETKPTHTFIMGGCNDIMAGYNINMVEDNICEIIKESLNYSIIPIVGIEPPIIEKLAVIYWGTDSDYSSVKNNQILYRKWTIDFCNKNRLNYIDFFELFSNQLKNIDADKLYIDGVHPSKSGHKLMADLVIPKLHEIFRF